MTAAAVTRSLSRLVRGSVRLAWPLLGPAGSPGLDKYESPQLLYDNKLHTEIVSREGKNTLGISGVSQRKRSANQCQKRESPENSLQAPRLASHRFPRRRSRDAAERIRSLMTHAAFAWLHSSPRNALFLLQRGAPSPPVRVNAKLAAQTDRPLGINPPKSFP